MEPIKEVVLEKTYDASPETVWQAWTNPEQLKQWWGPKQMRTQSLAFDPHVGGKYRWTLVDEKDEEMTVFGEYRELVPGKKIVFTWKWDDDEAWKYTSSVVTVELSDCDGGTELRLIHEKLPSEESRDRHNEGWNSVVDRLEKFFSK